MGNFVSDVRHSFRVLIKSPAFTIVAVLALALGIGANTAIFSVIDRVLLRPLPYKDSERILRVWRKYPQGTGDSVSPPKFMAWRRNGAFQSFAAYDFGSIGMGFGSGDSLEQAKALHVSAGFFDVFGVAPIRGRVFSKEEDLPGQGKLVVVTGPFWRNHLGGDPEIIGHTILLSNQPHVVIGILPEEFKPDPPADVYLPLQMDPNSTNQGHMYFVAGRLKPDETVASANAQFRGIGDQYRAQYPDFMGKDESIAALPLREAIVGSVKTPLLILGGAVCFVLLIACANVANLLLARAAGRRKEVAIRSAIGASRGRIVRQLLTESLMLAVTGGVAGFVLGAAGVKLLLSLSPGDIPRITGSNNAVATIQLLDWRVLIFTIGVSVLTGVVFGLFPAIQISRIDVNSSLKDSSGRAGTGRKQNRVRSILVVTEVSLALVLLVGAALMIGTFQAMRHMKSGFDPTHTMTFQIGLAGGRYDKTAQLELLTQQLQQRLESLPGVQSAASALVLPYDSIGVDLPFTIEGRVPKDKWDGDEFFRPISPHYFSTLKIPLLRGRTFDDRDSSRAPRVVILNAAFAEQYWKTGDPIGQRMLIGHGLGPDFEEGPREIVGIVGSTHVAGSKDVSPVMYIPVAQATDGMTKLADNLIPSNWLIRSAGDPLSVSSAVERELRAVDGQLHASNIKTMEAVMVDSTARQSFNMLLLSIFASVALLLASVGIYGLLAYAVEQRAQEIGIRMALGASRNQMLGMILRQGMALTGVGIAIGLGVAYGLARILANIMVEMSAKDPKPFVEVAMILATVAFFAALVPARRATAIDPVIAIRND